ncbi:MAG: hypothetical protein JNJ83_10905 [Verrucomicrobiaceae bacterium]|nr:hypothetical protein [Verrucomicrobiaceae bacterium]
MPGLSKSELLARKAAEAAQEALRKQQSLNPKFPFKVIPFDHKFFLKSRPI